MEITNTKKSKRDSNIELLRIIAIGLIVFYHLSINTGILDGNNVTIGMILGILGGIGGKIGVIAYVLITGYFSAGKPFKAKKIFILWLQLFCYSVGFMIVFNFILGQSIGTFDIIKNFFPLAYNHYWFVSVYLYMMLLSPFLNKFIESVSHEYYKKCLVILTFILIIMPSIFYSNELMKDLQIGTELLIFMYLYLLGGYIKKYGIKFFENHTKRNVLLIVGCYVLLTLMVVLIKSSSISDLWNLVFGYFRDMYSIWILVPAIALFCIFKDMKLKYNKVINYFASISLGVYLLHENNYMRPLLWKNVFAINKLDQNWEFVIYIIVAIILLFIGAAIVEYLRKNLIEKNVMKIKKIDKICNKIDNYINE